MKFPRPDGVSMSCGIICLGYAENDEGDLAFDWLEAYGAGDIAETREIKPLVWNEYHREGDLEELDAETPFGTFYKIQISVAGWCVQHDYNPFIGIFEGLEAAMTAAQQDYEKRIRSAFNIPSWPKP